MRVVCVRVVCVRVGCVRAGWVRVGCVRVVCVRVVCVRMPLHIFSYIEFIVKKHCLHAFLSAGCLFYKDLDLHFSTTCTTSSSKELTILTLR